MSEDVRTDLPYPGDELAFRVTSVAGREWFHASGRESVQNLSSALATVGRELESFSSILDFGCGPGRILLWLEHLAPEAELHGVDIDERAIRWAQAHIPWARVQVNDPLPPLPFADGQFDLVYNHSVFTHIDEAYQDAWLRELHRVTAPGAILLLSVNGDHGFAEFERLVRRGDGDADAVRAQLDREGIVFLQEDSWLGSAFPDFYHSTFHAPWYIAEHWKWFFDVRGHLAQGALGNQDIVVLERGAGSLPAGPPPVTRRSSSEPPPGREVTALERAAEVLASWPDPSMPSRFGSLGQTTRRAALRAMRPFTEHERRFDAELLEAVRDARQPDPAINAVRDGLLRQSERITRLELELLDRIEALERRIDALDARDER